MKIRYYIRKNVKGEFDLYLRDYRGCLDYLATYPTMEEVFTAVELTA